MERRDRQTPAERALELWEHAGVTCAIAVGRAICGYVQLPPGTAARQRWAQLNLPGGATYGPDEDGWIGFDTDHGGDGWAYEDIPAELMAQRDELGDMLDNLVACSALEPDQAARMAELLNFAHAADATTRNTWTMPRLREAVEQAAEQIVLLNALG